MTPSAATYSVSARAFHWVTALIVIFMIVAGILMLNMPDGPIPDALYTLHRSVGICLIPIAFARLFYRMTWTAPPLPADLPAVQQFAAHFVQASLYILIIVQPLIGWIATSAYRAPISMFWLFDMPPIWPEDRAFSDRMFRVHAIAGYLMAALICAHIAGALFHHVIRKDNVLMRMLTGRAA